MQNNTVTVIDGATNVITTIPTGPSPGAVAVNSDTNYIFVANTGNATMTVINAANNRTSQVTVGANPLAIAVSVSTNKVYVANQYPSGGNGSVTVWDGATNSTTTVAAGLYPSAVAVNPATNQIYVADAGDGTLTVVDGASDAATTIAVGSYPSAVAVNPITNKVYVANCIWYATATMLDGITLTTSTMDTGVYSAAVAVNPQTNMVYVANLSTNNVTVIAGAASPAMQFVPVSPCRVADTRLENGPLGGPPLAPGSTRSFPYSQRRLRHLLDGDRLLGEPHRGPARRAFFPDGVAHGRRPAAGFDHELAGRAHQGERRHRSLPAPPAPSACMPAAQPTWWWTSTAISFPRPSPRGWRFIRCPRAAWWTPVVPTASWADPI